MSSVKELRPRLLWALAASTLLPLLDSSLVNILLPAISTSLGAAASFIQYGISGYMLGATLGIIASANFERRFGATYIWRLSVCIFALSSLFVGLSTDVYLFVVARIVQGLASGCIMPALQAIVVDEVGQDGMRLALVSIGLPAVIAPSFGPLFGGALLELVGWRLLFIINIPVAALSLLLAKDLTNKLSKTRTHIAFLELVWVLLVILTFAASTTTHALVAWALFSICAAILVVSDIRAKEPVLNIKMYAHLPYLCTLLLCAIVGAVFYGTLLQTSLQIQLHFADEAWVAGVVLAVQGAGAWLTRNIVKGPLAKVPSFYLIAIGLILAIAGTWLIYVAPASFSLYMFAGAFMRGLGIGAATLLVLAVAYPLVDKADTHYVASNTRMAVQLGGAFGVALAASTSPVAFGIVIALACLGALIACVAKFLQQSLG